MWEAMKNATSNQVQWTRLEARVGAGMPDVNGAMSQGEFWIENKVCKTKQYKTDGLWRPLQVSWQHNRAKLFLNVWNLVSHPADEKLYLYCCSQIIALNSDGNIPKAELVMTYPLDWNPLLKHIKQRLCQNSAAMDECAYD